MKGRADNYSNKLYRGMHFEIGLYISELECCTTHLWNTIENYILLNEFNGFRGKQEKEKKSDLISPFTNQVLLDDQNKREGICILQRLSTIL